ncbi:hypothetical protein RI864_002083 [Salmonella enterica]|nr:hypothetical protein [Salmonella enterica]EBW8697958.1 hypothetical protein [Salmonella enterica subsp. diarizonae serovar 16:z10:e,n,x,z15]EGF5178138.1 hypothetical protein [Salmonella enterica subsp. enterica serovar Newport]EAA9130243.1 hypothetical protein [Salmonella enterica]EAA9303050.1 hypothetical protein [Salmonella enterica]
MTTITRERLEWLSKISGRDDMDDINGDEIRELACIALASLEAEPVAYMCKDGDDVEYNGHDEFSGGSKGVPLYAAPPAPVVPEEITDESTEQRLMGRRWAHSFCAGWNACRATMLKGDAK